MEGRERNCEEDGANAMKTSPLCTHDKFISTRVLSPVRVGNLHCFLFFVFVFVPVLSRHDTLSCVKYESEVCQVWIGGLSSMNWTYASDLWQVCIWEIFVTCFTSRNFCNHEVIFFKNIKFFVSVIPLKKIDLLNIKRNYFQSTLHGTCTCMYCFWK